jgi:hypothetical protein
MANAQDIVLAEQKLKILCYGDFGTGKSTFAASFPKPYFLDFDKGVLSVGGRDVNYETFMKNGKEFKRFNSHMAQHVIPKIKSGEIQTLVLDSLTTYSEVVLMAILDEAKVEFPRIQDWGMQINGMVTTINMLSDLPCHVIFLAHEQTQVNEDNVIIKGMPLVTGKLAPKIGLYFDEVYRTKVRSGQFVLQTKNQGGFLAKSRLDGFLKNVGKQGIPNDLPQTYAALLDCFNKEAEVKETNKPNQPQTVSKTPTVLGRK